MEPEKVCDVCLSTKQLGECDAYPYLCLMHAYECPCYLCVKR